jgi:hypothetical protein
MAWSWRTCSQTSWIIFVVSSRKISKKTETSNTSISTTVKKFYKKELREIEEETISLLTYKNYYEMKKTMMVSGIVP